MPLLTEPLEILANSNLSIINFPHSSRTIAVGVKDGVAIIGPGDNQSLRYQMARKNARHILNLLSDCGIGIKTALFANSNNPKYQHYQLHQMEETLPTEVDYEYVALKHYRDRLVELDDLPRS